MTNKRKNFINIFIGVLLAPLWIPAGIIFLAWMCLGLPAQANDPKRDRSGVKIKFF